jgi:hypothetical protein
MRPIMLGYRGRPTDRGGPRESPLLMKGPLAATSSLAAALVGAMGLAPAVARAEPAGDSDKTVAESLDAEGRALLDQRHYDEACDRFSESYRLLPGNGVLLRLGLCQELQGKTASAWLTFRDAAARAHASGDAQVERLATRRATAIEPRLSRLTVRLDPDASAAPLLRVTRDGVSLGRAALGSPLPIDPGSHRIEASTPDGQQFTQTVVIAGGGDETVTVTFDHARAVTAAAPAGEPAPAPLAGQAPADAPAGQAVEGPARQAKVAAPVDEAAARKKPTPAADVGLERAWSAQKTAALAVGGLGLAGLGTGVAFQLAVFAKRDRAESLCPTRRDCSPEAISARDEGKSNARFAAATFAAGAAGVVGGLVLWFTAPSASSSTRARAPHLTPVLAAGHVAVRMEGTW